MNKKDFVIIFCILLAFIVIFPLIRPDNDKKDFDEILNDAMNETLTADLTPYDQLTVEQKEIRWRKLKSAISFGNIEVSNKLLENVDFDPQSDESYELLHQAVRAKKNSSVLTEYLIDAGLTDVNKIFFGGQTLLHTAAYKGHSETAEILIKKGAKVNAIDSDSEFGKSFHETPLHVSAQYGTWEVAEVLLQNGADWTSKNVAGDTPLDYAQRSADPDHESKRGKKKVAKLITEHIKETKKKLQQGKQ